MLLKVERIESKPPMFRVATLVRVQGEVDLAAATAFRNSLNDAAANDRDDLIVSLEECTYFGSTGLAVLVAVRNSIGDRLKVVATKGSICYRILQITGLDKALGVVSSISAAFEQTW